MTISGFVCLIAAAAARGQMWAAGTLVALATLAVALAMYALSFVVIQLLGVLFDRIAQRRAHRARSPAPEP